MTPHLLTTLDEDSALATLIAEVSADVCNAVMAAHRQQSCMARAALQLLLLRCHADPTLMATAHVKAAIAEPDNVVLQNELAAFLMQADSACETLPGQLFDILDKATDDGLNAAAITTAVRGLVHSLHPSTHVQKPEATADDTESPA